MASGSVALAGRDERVLFGRVRRSAERRSDPARGLLDVGSLKVTILMAVPVLETHRKHAELEFG